MCAICKRPHAVHIDTMINVPRVYVTRRFRSGRRNMSRSIVASTCLRLGRLRPNAMLDRIVVARHAVAPLASPPLRAADFC